MIEQLCVSGMLPPPRLLRGVPTTDLDDWERELGFKLPDDYRTFMEVAGASSDAALFTGSSFFWPAPLDLRAATLASLEPDEYALIPDDALFVLDHQGYIFVWLETHDPRAPVYVLQPVDVGAREVKRIADSFREWLLGTIPKSHRSAARR